MVKSSTSRFVVLTQEREEHAKKKIFWMIHWLSCQNQTGFIRVSLCISVCFSMLWQFQNKALEKSGCKILLHSLEASCPSPPDLSRHLLSSKSVKYGPHRTLLLSALSCWANHSRRIVKKKKKKSQADLATCSRKKTVFQENILNSWTSSRGWMQTVHPKSTQWWKINVHFTLGSLNIRPSPIFKSTFLNFCVCNIYNGHFDS